MKGCHHKVPEHQEPREKLKIFPRKNKAWNPRRQSRWYKQDSGMSKTTDFSSTILRANEIVPIKKSEKFILTLEFYTQQNYQFRVIEQQTSLFQVCKVSKICLQSTFLRNISKDVLYQNSGINEKDEDMRFWLNGVLLKATAEGSPSWGPCCWDESRPGGTVRWTAAGDVSEKKWSWQINWQMCVCGGRIGLKVFVQSYLKMWEELSRCSEKVKQKQAGISKRWHL